MGTQCATRIQLRMHVTAWCHMINECGRRSWSLHAHVTHDHILRLGLWFWGEIIRERWSIKGSCETWDSMDEQNIRFRSSFILLLPLFTHEGRLYLPPLHAYHLDVRTRIVPDCTRFSLRSLHVDRCRDGCRARCRARCRAICGRHPALRFDGSSRPSAWKGGRIS